jgi:HTH-type transcriptional regulator/antitoxin HigA
MIVKIIRNEREYNAAVKRADEIFDAKRGTAKGDELSLLLLVIKDYEDRTHPVPVPDPIQALKIKMEEQGLSNKDLEPYIGSKSYVSQILNKRKPLTAEIMKMLHSKLGIPANILLAS